MPENEISRQSECKGDMLEAYELSTKAHSLRRMNVSRKRWDIRLLGQSGYFNKLFVTL